MKSVAQQIHDSQLEYLLNQILNHAFETSIPIINSTKLYEVATHVHYSRGELDAILYNPKGIVTDVIEHKTYNTSGYYKKAQEQLRRAHQRFHKGVNAWYLSTTAQDEPHLKLVIPAQNNPVVEISDLTDYRFSNQQIEHQLV